MTVLTYHLSVSGCGGWVNSEALRRIAYLVGAHRALAIRCIRRQIEARSRRGVDIVKSIDRQVTHVTCSRVCKCFVKDIEEPGPELELLALADIEVLEEGDIPIVRC